jgi:hypothetical protein
VSEENEKGRDGPMDLWPGRPNGERWASATGTGILPLPRSGMSESGAEKMGFFRRFHGQVGRMPRVVCPVLTGDGELHSLHTGGLGGMKDGCLTLNEGV